MPTGIYKRTNDLSQKLSEAQKNSEKQKAWKSSERFKNILRERNKNNPRFTMKGRKWTKEQRERQSQLNKITHNTPECKEKCRKINLGKKMSSETIEKMRLVNIGRKASKETIEKMRRSMIGKNLGKHHSESTKEKIRIIHLGKHLSEEHKRKVSFALKNHPTTDETKLKISKANLGRHRTEEMKQKMSGINSSNWMGGISFEPYSPEFNNTLKENIRKRDQYRCRECMRHQNELFKNTKNGIRPCKLSIHHIDFNKKNNAPNNLISLCSMCHMQTNYNRADWTEHFNDVLNI